ncbi:MAG: lipopolysaccharide heptosyltransferase II [Burkholderiales bacterium]|nr:lipopolysaccharide heptosyltransferase II [Burkholderiales bacterium]
MPAGRTLVVAPNWLGDSLMAQPLLTRLRAKQPSMAIDVLATPAVTPVFRRMPEVDQVFEEDFRHGQLGLRRRWRIGRAFRGRYAQAFVLPNAWKSALVPFFADIDLRVGYVGESRYGLLNVTHRNPTASREMPMTRFYAQLAEPPGRRLVDELPAPWLRVDPLAAIAAKVTLGLKPAARIAALCVGAEYGPAKRWPTEHFAELASRLAAAGMTPIVLGTQKDVPAGLSIEQLSSGAALNLAGRTSLDEAILLIAGSAVVVTNDSGLMHVAAALGRPQVALFGSSSPAHTPPLSEAATVVYRELSCSPCFARECPLGHLRCLREIAPAAVAELALGRSA